jgi:hypothetical protein
MDYEEHYTGSQRVLSKGELFFTSLEQQVRRYIDMGKENSWGLLKRFAGVC